MCQCREDLIADLNEKVEHCTALAEALRDIYNDVGEDPVVNREFNKVYKIVKEYA